MDKTIDRQYAAHRYRSIAPLSSQITLDSDDAKDYVTEVDEEEDEEEYTEADRKYLGELLFAPTACQRLTELSWLSQL